MSWNRHNFRKNVRSVPRRFRGSPWTPHNLSFDTGLWDPEYVPPYDLKEKHLPGMNYCGPGTNVRRRLANKVQPVDGLDKLCLEHDIWTEPRGPYRSRGKRNLLRAADRRLLNGAKLLRKQGYEPSWKVAIVIVAMEMLLEFGGRGR